MNDIIVIRGAGDIATGVASALHNCGYKIICCETKQPTTIRRKVAFSEAIYEGHAKVEKIQADYCKNIDEIKNCWKLDNVAVIVDEKCEILKEVKPIALIDAILAKKNLGTTIDMAPLTIALGPGFCAGNDTTYVIETMRGHDLGRIITQGYAIPNTGVPGLVGGQDVLRVIHAECSGTIKNISKISDVVKQGQVIANISTEDGKTIDVKATLDGVLRGLIKSGHNVKRGLKIADIDPRTKEKDNCFTISDKARALGGSVLQAIGMYEKSKCQLWQNK